MTHEEIKQNLQSYFDGRLEAAERQEITAHTGSCPGCLKVLNSLELMRRVLSEAKRIPASETFVQHVLSRIEELEQTEPVHERHASPAFRFFVPALAYSFAFVLMFAAIISRQTPINAEAILLTDMPDYSQWAVAEEEPSMDDFIVMEQGGN